MDSKTWWIIIAIIVVVLILILIAMWQGKRRKAARRDEAQQLRGRARENEGTVVESRQRAESASEQAERARAEAEAKQQKADELEAEAQHEQKAADAVERDHAETLKKADQLDPDTPTDRHGNRVEGTGARGTGEGESRIDSDTGRPVEEAGAGRERDVRADRTDDQHGRHEAGHHEQHDVRSHDGAVTGGTVAGGAAAGGAAAGYDQPRDAGYEQQGGIRPEGDAIGGGQHEAGYDQSRDAGYQQHNAGYEQQGGIRPEGGAVAGQPDESGRQHVTRPDGTVGDAQPGAYDQQSGTGSHGVFDRERNDNDVPAAEDGVDDSDGSPVKDKVNRLFGRHAGNNAGDNGPEQDGGFRPPKH